VASQTSSGADNGALDLTNHMKKQRRWWDCQQKYSWGNAAWSWITEKLL